MTTVAFIGLGAMGSLMAKNLVAAGMTLRVYNRQSERTRAFAEMGVPVFETPAKAAQGADFVVSMVADDDATRSVMLGAEGVVGAANAGTVIIDSSTNTPSASREVAQRAAERGIAYLDAPVSGSLPQARGRELVFMVGGERAAFERAQPLFAAMGRQTSYMGASGSGASIKLINNMLSGTVSTALAEALTVAEAAGLDAKAVQEVLGEGAAASRLLKGKMPKMLGRDFSPQFQLSLMEKDLRYFLALAQSVDVPAPIASLVRSQLQSARRAGLGGLDVAAVYLQSSGRQARQGPPSE
jgi:3-hydroxyisobutyrate dehydrogenase-like beta-hydroxyacid dehydrogenase